MLGKKRSPNSEGTTRQISKLKRGSTSVQRTDRIHLLNCSVTITLQKTGTETEGAKDKPKSFKDATSSVKMAIIIITIIL